MSEYDWTSVWLTPEVAKTQEALMQREYDAWLAGAKHAPFTAFDRLARKTEARSVVDMGCGAGIYGLLWSRIDRGRYTGCDQSPQMIDLAMKHEVSKKGYWVCDAMSLPCPDQSFDMAFLGAILCCTEHWEKVVSEAARVARKYLLFHRMPMYADGPDTKVVMHDVYGAQAPYREFREEFIEEYMAQFGRIIGSELWPCEGYFMGSYLVEKD